MKFFTNNVEDISRYYKNCYVQFKERGTLLHRVDKITDKKVTGVNENDDPFVLELREEDPYVMSFVLPKKALFRHRNSLYLLEKKPAKQFKRGISSENTLITNVATGTRAEIGFSILKSYVSKQTHVSLREAMTKRGASIISSRFWYSPGNGSLYLDRQLVASIFVDGSFKMVLNSFLEDVEELLNAK
jgi:hypothetical protein